MQDEIRIELEQLADRFVQKGHTAPDVLAAMKEALDDLTTSYDEGPDPSDDPKQIDEPANDWPAA
ncbi:hypothetical protein [Agrobacterium pusense]|uniref:hypothetical protein n=1 Tax=Agrobacterium pusense TaxID=648995 RepID=UPI0005144F04|nr:hypothetical protein [Agrobacterium pusense]ANV25651.1 hypothetical protein BA939_16675 [Rhizobium sp. S41]KGE80254.1 hypothetical protein LW14_24180 [Rhizobium sp. H41]QWW76501.1 hypothetical protein KP800_14910 [Agrobacterium pusense]HCJ72691.1 hypothetical protein [Agrobacterium sp.]